MRAWQLPLPFEFEADYTFDNFVAAGNEIPFHHLCELAQQRPPEPIYLWGDSGAGKTHLLRAFVETAQQQGERVAWFSSSSPVPWPGFEDSTLIVLDDCQALNAHQQHAAFIAFVDATGRGVPVLAAGKLPPVDLPLRDDLRSRLGWGHVLHVQLLSETALREVLNKEATRRGLRLSEEVLNYLLRRFDRHINTLLPLVEQLDRFSLSRQRLITLPLLKEMLKED
jgi:DnaA-homolog protein